MQLYHHPFSLDSQKVRLALEEKNIDYTSFHVNPITGKNYEASFFRKNPSGKLPVFQNGSHILYDTIEIIQYIDRIAMVSSGRDDSSVITPETIEWIQKIQKWNPKFFTLSHLPPKHRLSVSKFLRRVIISRMAECPELASAYHQKLKDAYETDDKMRNAEILRRSEEHLDRILDEAESQLSETDYLIGQEFTLADVVFVPVLSRLAIMDLEEKYINTRPNLAEYWKMVRLRPSYKKVIGKYFDGWRKHKTLFKTWCFVQMRSLLKQY
ncbi:glutathione s-transferase tchqd [Phtheirospermum japonicum]|uniref:Glutathione s-transferase tchqd n=1 Tax=Phtheirospermum japonicum TaxID=374723 RepID=A0A830BSS4_9LAMI|nr:glutathione s-transferase tchqd [Phtheirospermum japonicum]